MPLVNLSVGIIEPLSAGRAAHAAKEGREFFIELVLQGESTPQEYHLFKIGWSRLGNPGVVVGSEARFLLQGMNLALHRRHLVV